MADHPGVALEDWGEDHEVVVVLHIAGKSDQQIAATLGRSETWVRGVLDSDRALHACAEFERSVVDQVASRASHVQGRLRSYAGEALDQLVEILRMSTEEKMRFKAATAILDRAGFTAVQRSVVAGTTLPAEVADRMEEALQDMQAIDADYSILPREPADA